jgi:hypothetical protein
MMKITDRRCPKTAKFGHLQVGTVFKHKLFEEFYIKTSIVDDDNELIINAVRLDNGLATYFDDNDEIVKVDAELVIT